MASPVLLKGRFLLGGLLAGAAGLYAFWPQPAPPAPPPREKVVFWHMWSAEQKAVVDRIVARYNGSQDRYRVEALSIPGATATAKFLLAAVGSTPPDLMAQWFPVIPNWADNGLLRPVDELMTAEDKRVYRDEVYPIIRRMGTYKGRLYGVCTGATLGGLYVNADALRRAGYDPDVPAKTLEELRERAERLTTKDDKGEIRTVGFLPYDFRVYAEAYGGGIYDWERGRVTLDTPANRKAMAYIAESRKRIGYDNVVRFEAGLTGADNMSGWRFITGAYAMTVDGPWRVEQLRKFAPNFDYRVHPVPPAAEGGAPGGGVANGNFMLIPRAGRNPKGAMDFIRFWSGLEKPERAAEFYPWGNWLPLTPRVSNAPAYRAYLKAHPQFQTFVDLMSSPNMNPTPPVGYQQFLLDTVIRFEERATRGRVSPAGALQEGERGLARELDRRKKLGYVD